MHVFLIANNALLSYSQHKPFVCSNNNAHFHTVQCAVVFCFFFVVVFFIVPHSYIPPCSGLGTGRLICKHQLLKQNSQPCKNSVRINRVHCKMHQYDFVVVVVVVALH